MRTLSLHALLSPSAPGLSCLVEQHTLSPPYLTVTEMDRYFYILINKFKCQIWHVVDHKPLKKMEVYEMIWLNIHASFIMDTEIDVYLCHYLFWRIGINITSDPYWTLQVHTSQSAQSAHSHTV